MLLKWLLAAVLLVAGSGLVLALAAMRTQPLESHPFFAAAPARPLVIAHRGGALLWPENTLLAFHGAAELGADLIETDVHATADGALVLLHDRTVDRTTDGSGALGSLSLSELKQLDAAYHWTPDGGLSFPYRGAGHTIPTLEEAFTALPGMRFNLELKRTDPGVPLQLCQLVRARGMQHRVLVASFDGPAVREFRRVCPEVATSATLEEARTFVALKYLPSPPYTPAAQALQLPERYYGIRVISPRLIAAAHARNLHVHAWTINEPDAMRRLLDLGVDGIVTDRPDAMMEVMAER